jgi:hypothetical protein
MIQTLEELATVYPFRNTDRVRDARALQNFIEPEPRLIKQQDFRYAAHWATVKVLQWVSTACDEVEDQRTPLNRLMTALREKFRVLTFSLNYDDVPEHDGVQLYTGYETADRFDGISVSTLDFNDHSHFQLHGSVLNEVPVLGSPTNLVRRHHSRLKARASYGTLRSPRLLDDGHFLTCSPIVTGHRKHAHMSREPFASYYASFRQAAMSCPNWLIVGYGFGDYHINAVLQSAFQSRRIDGHDPRVVVVDYRAFDPSGKSYVMQPTKRADLERAGIDNCSPQLNRMFSAWAGPELNEFIRRVRSDSHNVYAEEHYRETSPTEHQVGSVRPKRFTSLCDSVLFTFDGLEWAASTGLSEITTFLS